MITSLPIYISCTIYVYPRNDEWLLYTSLASKRPDFSSATLKAKLYQIRFPACPPKLENTTSFDSPLSRHSLLQDVVQTFTLPIIILLVF